MLRRLKTDAGQLRGSRRQNLRGNLHARADAAAEEGSGLVDCHHGRRRAHVDDDHRRGIIAQRGNRRNDQVAADLTGVSARNIQTRFKPRSHDHGRASGELHNRRAQRIQNRRHDGRDDHALNFIRLQIVERQHTLEVHPVLIGRFDKVGGKPQLVANFFCLDAADDNVGIADINC